MSEVRVASVERVEDLYVLAVLELDGARVWAELSCLFEADGETPLVSEGMVLDVCFSVSVAPDRIHPIRGKVPGVYGEDEDTTLVGLVQSVKDNGDFTMNCGAFDVEVSLIRPEKYPQRTTLGELVEIHVGTTITAIPSDW